ncbi:MULTISPECIES: hypothetical protein [Bacillus]|uniref:hypothetical protein n=1 Tax=Bacillus TaxID=1386 RepID=UPI00037B08DB|nr:MULTISPECIES: hypothetical protein [Bacillus]
MALLPLKQTITIKREGELDEWGESTGSSTSTLKCRVDESSKVVQNSLGNEVVAGMEITLNKLADIKYGDQIEYTNELGVTILREPIRIEVVRMINGKPVLTTVYA